MAVARGLDAADDPARAIDELAACRDPWLFGVRHHSPACAAALPALLDALAPTVIAIELPADLAPWLDWLGHPEAAAPLAIAAVSDDGDELGFYPFADFSPELVALRWGRAHGVPVHAIDLPARARGGHGREPRDGIGISARLPGDDSWEQLVEAPAVLADPERVRRAALLYGWALRLDAARGDGVPAFDLAREQHMRIALARLGAGGARVAAIVGSFHAAALLPTSKLWLPPPPRDASNQVELVSSLIPYGFELLDARSGYPAGIRDPRWQQRLWQTLDARGDVSALVAECLVEITRGVRARGLPASPADALAATELAISLARLRQLAAPGRSELIEAVQTSLAHGELLGRGRVIARAMHAVLVGTERGHLAPGTPRSGLGPHVAALLAELRLPHAQMVEPDDIRLDPLRSPLDRRRHVALCRLRAAGVPYAQGLASTAAGGLETLTTTWRIHFTPATEAMLELAGLRGVTLRQAAAGTLRAERARLATDDKLTPARLIDLTASAADAGAAELTRDWLVELCGPRLTEAQLPDLVALVSLIDRLLAGHVVALPLVADDAVPGEIDVFAPPPPDGDRTAAAPLAAERANVLAAAVASIAGLAGSDSLDDARSLAELVRLLDASLGDARLRWSLAELARAGAPLIAGAASLVQVLIGAVPAEDLSIALAGWLDAAVAPELRSQLAQRLRGAIAVAGPLLESAPIFLDGLATRVEQLADDAFLARVASLRRGFEVLSTASRARLLRVLGDRLGASDARGLGLDVVTEIDPALLALAAAADRAGRAAMSRIAPAVAAATTTRDTTATTHPALDAGAHDLSPIDRWRMILGHERDRMQPRAARGARALDELYGTGHGEGSRGGAGREAAFPTVREWRDELEDLFGDHVFQEVAGQAAAGGRVAALLELDPAQVTPSIELLQQVLALKGGLGEAQLGRLRALIRRVVDELVRALAVRVRPALHGATGARPTRRPTSALHLPRTVAANLARVRELDGERRLVPERFYFRQRNRRQLDWHVVLIVDVSGSMEPSVIYSAMMAAILSAVPWIAVQFLAFSTEVIDLTEHVSDPLALLLEVEVGGGTHLAKALRYARSRTQVPARTILIVVSDFEEGFAPEALVAEVRALVESGVTCLGLAALDDRGAPRYSAAIAELVVGAGMPVAALTPLELARWIGAKIR